MLYILLLSSSTLFHLNPMHISTQTSKEVPTKLQKPLAKVIDVVKLGLVDKVKEESQRPGEKDNLNTDNKEAQAPAEAASLVPATPMLQVSAGDEPAISFSKDQIHAAFMGATKVNEASRGAPLVKAEKRET